MSSTCFEHPSVHPHEDLYMQFYGRAQLKPDGTRWRTVGEVKGKHASEVGSQQSCTVPQNMVYPTLLPLLSLMRTPRLPVVDWTDTPPPPLANLNGLVRFAERSNLVSARVPSRFKRAVLQANQAHPAIGQTAYMDAWQKYHKTACVQVFLRMNTWMFETCRRH